jgi:glycosyltransferase involved in cell wall biosynthesis
MPGLTIIILTCNEELNIKACLSSLAGLACDGFIVDSGSTDRTLDIASLFPVQTVYHKFQTHATQWQWALEDLPIQTDWVLGLDADQSLSAALKDEIKLLFAGRHRVHALENLDGLYLNRAHIYRGRFIRHGACYPKYLLKLFRRTSVYLDPVADLLDHHFYVRGRTAKLDHDLIEENRKEWRISFWTQKHVRYAELVAEEELRFEQQQNGTPTDGKFIGGSPDQKIIALKRLWRRMPLYVRPTCYFLYRYFIRLGFLDGKQGFIFHFLHAFWFRLLVDVNLDELRNGVAGLQQRVVAAPAAEPAAKP